MTFTSPHYQFEEIAQGVYAALATETGAARSNAGIIDLGDQTLVFDTGMTPQSARDLRAAAERLAGRAAGLIINSHYHNDHIRGNMAFGLPSPDSATHILATLQTRALMAERIPPTIEQHRQMSAARVGVLEKQLAAATDADKRRKIAYELASLRGIVDSLPTLELRLPTLTFEHKLTLHGARRTAQIITFGGGHSPSDSILYLPGEQIAFMADLVFVQRHPWLGDGNPTEWVRMLNEVEALGVQRVVPGHGPVGDVEDLALMRRYLTEFGALAQIGQGRVSHLPAPFDAWWDPGSFFEPNMQFLYKHSQAKQAG
ncbi:MAG: MBL fold metallo-hydrolase [Anaerolineales bacterium]